MTRLLGEDMLVPCEPCRAEDATVLSQAGEGTDASPKLEIRGLSKRYGSVFALRDVELFMRSGEFLTVLGPSGSGKTTLLQIVSGLVEPSEGRLFIDGRDETATPASRRGIGVVFQSYALFPHLTVRENIAFPLAMRRLPAAEIARKVSNVLDMVELGALGERFPQELSGGQQQRVALARCLVYEPALILMDEPLSALDRRLRETMQMEIKRLHRETGATIMFVTHDQEEALALSDRICLMDHARIVQLGTPAEIYERPASLFAADFIGISSILRGTVDGPNRLQTSVGPLALASGSCRPATGTRGALVLRPEHIELTPDDASFGHGRVEEVVYAGFETRIVLRTDAGETIVARIGGGGSVPAVGARIGFRWPPDKAVFIAE